MVNRKEVEREARRHGFVLEEATHRQRAMGDKRWLLCHEKAPGVLQIHRSFESLQSAYDWLSIGLASSA